MSVSLNLEIAEGSHAKDVFQVFETIDGVEWGKNEKSSSLYFTHTNTNIFIEMEPTRKNIMAEDTEDLNWQVAMRIFFYIDLGHHHALDDVKKFIINLSNMTPILFVLSLHFESLYAVRDQNGLRLMGGFLPNDA
ncbi:hypothetical protein RND59_16245 [Vibrio ruber]|uniref:hypothetical protein n=1 Tax=Vibrio ruber TaxID=184755 RepID=UPI002892E872|nr:hypothetical protein [Vibrio ruber]WNJ97681.1 hypothetical protein RND59_16245 [Vibrio ruber]